MYSAYKRILSIKYLPDDTDVTINTLFSKFGKILSHIFVPTTDPWKKDALVELESEHLAIQARRELHGKVFYDSKLYVDFASTQEAQTLINSTLEGAKSKTSVLDRIITQKDLKESKKILENLSGEGGLKNLSTTPEKVAEKPQKQEVLSGKRNLEERIESDNERPLEKEEHNYEEIQKKIKVDNSSLAFSSGDLQAPREESSLFPQQQLDSVHETHQTNVSYSNRNEERLNDQTYESHQVKVENKNEALSSVNNANTTIEKKEGGDDVVETLLANNPELKAQIGNPAILKAFFDVFRQEVNTLNTKNSAEKERSEVKKEHGSSRSKRRSHSKSGERSISSSSRHRHRSRRRKLSYSNSRSPSSSKRMERRSDRKKSRRSHSRSKSSSKSLSRSEDRHRRSNKKHRRDRDSYSSSGSSSSRDRSRSRRNRHRERRSSRSRSGQRSTNKSELPVFDEKLLFEKFEQITKQFVSQKGANNEIAEEKITNKLDSMQDDHIIKLIDSHNQIPQENEAGNILAGSNISGVPEHDSLKEEHVHQMISTPKEQTPENKSQQESQHQNDAKENIGETKSILTLEPRQEGGFKYSSVSQLKVGPENKNSTENPLTVQSNISQLVKGTSSIKEQEGPKFVYSCFITENRRQNLTLKLNKSSKPFVSFKEMYLNSYKTLGQQQSLSSLAEDSSSSTVIADTSNTNLQNPQVRASTNNAKVHVGPNLVIQEKVKNIVDDLKSHLSQTADPVKIPSKVGEEEQKANKEAGLKFIKLLQRQEELAEEEKKLRLECLADQEAPKSKKKKKNNKGAQEAYLGDIQQNQSDDSETDIRTKHDNRHGIDLRQTLNQMRQGGHEVKHIIKSKQEDGENEMLEYNNLINNDFIKKNNLEGFIKYFMTGGDVDSLKEKLKTLAKPN